MRLQWTWAHDRWDSTEPEYAPWFLKHTIYRYDKVQHFILGMFCCWLFTAAAWLQVHRQVGVRYTSGGSGLLWTVFEILNGFGWGPKKYAGFSWKDWVCSLAGALVGGLILLLIGLAL